MMANLTNYVVDNQSNCYKSKSNTNTNAKNGATYTYHNFHHWHLNKIARCCFHRIYYKVDIAITPPKPSRKIN